MRPIICAACIAMLLASPPARSHVHTEADGSTVSWYPRDCCHNGDCRPVSRLGHAPNGLWMETVDGQTVLIGPKQKRQTSKDMRWHICIGPDDTDTPTVRCVFEPPDS
jgi:hypothetical protein